MLIVILMLLVVLGLAARDLLRGQDSLGKHFQIRIGLSLLLFMIILGLDAAGWIVPSQDLQYLGGDNV
jgi:Ni/Fe-hydrogenase subunit HybB-like protein